MNYQETLNWMFNRLPVYQFVGASAYKADLSNAILISDHLGNPEKKLKCIHVAGTNGKGSTSHFLASVLQEAGYKVGLFTSPHLKDFRERIKINGNDISEQEVIDFIDRNKPFLEQNDLSFFEMTIGLAFEYFANQKTDICIIEVGLGGRLDSTNIISPLISVITNIGLDHTAILGNTLTKIATEKAGIIKPNIPVVIGEYNEETKPVFEAKSEENNTKIYFASDLIHETFESDLLGDYQLANKKTVLQTLKILQSQKQFNITTENIKNGFLNVVKNTKLLGRWQQLSQNPKIICDTAHNAHGLKVVLNQIKNEQFKQLHFVLGFVNDKNLDDVLPLFPKNAHYYFCKPNISRGLDENELLQKAKQFGLIGESFVSVSMAYEVAKLKATPNDFIYLGGSNFVVAEIL